MSSPLKIIIDDTLNVESAQPKKLEKAIIDESVLIKNLVLKVDTVDGQPVLYGTLSEFGSRVNVTWQSLVVSSALIADSTDGSFSIKAPQLDQGRHVLYLQTIRKRDNALSRTIKINFDLTQVEEEEPVLDSLQQGANFVKAKFADVYVFIAEQPWPVWIIVAAFLLLIIRGMYLFFWSDKKEKKK